jgi:DNA-binding ferritin-like protein
MKTRKRNQSNRIDNVILMFLELLNIIKLYHWKTKSFPEHKNTDDLYSSLNEKIDKFVEVLLGRMNTRPQQSLFKINAYNFSSTEELKKYILKIKKELVKMNYTFKNENDLLNLRDEIMADIHKFEYLLTFK